MDLARRIARLAAIGPGGVSRTPLDEQLRSSSHPNEARPFGLALGWMLRKWTSRGESQGLRQSALGAFRERPSTSSFAARLTPTRLGLLASHSAGCCGNGPRAANRKACGNRPRGRFANAPRRAASQLLSPQRGSAFGLALGWILRTSDSHAEWRERGLLGPQSPFELPSSWSISNSPCPSLPTRRMRCRISSDAASSASC